MIFLFFLHALRTSVRCDALISHIKWVRKLSFYYFKYLLISMNVCFIIIIVCVCWKEKKKRENKNKQNNNNFLFLVFFLYNFCSILNDDSRLQKKTKKKFNYSLGYLLGILYGCLFIYLIFFFCLPLRDITVDCFFFISFPISWYDICCNCCCIFNINSFLVNMPKTFRTQLIFQNCVKNKKKKIK